MKKKKEDYHEKQFEGNETNKFLNNTSKIRDVIDEPLYIFVDCMDSLHKVKKSCFGFTLGASYKEDQRF